MEYDELVSEDDRVTSNLNRSQLERFTGADPRCRGLQLPEGLLLRYNLSRSLFFYLRSGVKSGMIVTRIFASDSPYDREKTLVGEVATPMFAEGADSKQFDRVEKMLYAWVDFVKDVADEQRDFTSFEMSARSDH